MVLVEIKQDIVRFICSECKKTISTGQNFLVDLSKLPKNRVSSTGEGMYYTCLCGSKYDLIKNPDPELSGMSKFKHVKVIEQEYALY